MEDNFNLEEQLSIDDKKQTYADFKAECINQISSWLSAAPGEFSVRDIDYDLCIDSPEKRKIRLEILEELVEKNELERVGSKRGYYRPYHMDLTPLKIGKVDFQYERFWLPFRLHDYVGIMPGNIIVIAGVPNAGKTALLMNLIKNNRKNFNNIDYFNSESGEQELNLRLSKFDISLSDWNINAWERAENFADVVRSGKGNLNVIDFLECHDEFYKMGHYIKEIHSKLDGAIAVVAIQKNAGQDNGLGGFRSMEKARLAISLDSGKMKVTKAKNFVTDLNPNGLMADYTLAQGCKFLPAKESKGEKVWYKND